MRTQSMKSLVATLTMVVVFAAAAPAASARPAQPRTRDSVSKTVRLLWQKLTGGFTMNSLPSPPIPGPKCDDDTTIDTSLNSLPSPPIPK